MPKKKKSKKIVAKDKNLKQEGAEKKVKATKIPVNYWMYTTFLFVIISVALIGIYTFTGCIIGKSSGTLNVVSPEKAATDAINYLNTYLLQGNNVTLVNTSEESGMYAMKVKLNGKIYDSYVTKDGKLFFPSAINLTNKPEIQTSNNNNNAKKKTCEEAEITKVDDPLLQAFVVSYCPFGIQMQRILSGMPDELKKHIEIRYIGSVSNGKITSMHGNKEAIENLRQICIREEQNDKFWDYVSCFIKDGNTDSCLDSAGIDRAKLKACMNDSNRGIKYAQSDFDLDNKYKITGSPTLILNGKRASEFDFGGRSEEAVKTLICCGFNNQPDICSQKLREEQAATSFSKTYSTSSGSSSGGGSC